MELEVCQDIENIVQSWTYELPLSLISSVNTDGSIILNSDDALQVMLEQQHLINNDLLAAKDKAVAVNASLKWQLKQEKMKPERVEYRERKVTTGYISLKEHEQVRIALAKKLDEHELASGVLTESNKLMSVDLDSIKPALEQSHAANKQLIIKLTKSKEQVASSVERENANAKTFDQGAKAFQEEIKLLRSQRTLGIATIKNLKDRLVTTEQELKKTREIVAVSSKHTLWENKRRGTYLTYLGVRGTDGEQPTATDGTELDMSKPLFQFHHPSGVSRVVLCGVTDKTKAIFCSNTAASMPTEKEKREISELVDSMNFNDVHEHFEKQEADRKSKTKLVGEAASKVRSTGSLTKAKAKSALKELRNKNVEDMSPETIQSITDAHMLAEDELMNSRDSKVRAIKNIDSKMTESKRNKNRAKRKGKK
jgi:hypothetical protein